jgi:hypothetical protein
MALIQCPECKKNISETAANCPKCGWHLTPEKVLKIKAQQAEEQAQQQKVHDFLHKPMTGKGCLVIVAIFVGLIIIGVVSDKNQPSNSVHDSANPEWAAISAIRQRYKPSTRLLMLNPDVDSANWLAYKDPFDECTYVHAEHANCWKVIYTINVMPGAESKEIKCKWLINMDTMEHQALDTETRTMFDGS